MVNKYRFLVLVLLALSSLKCSNDFKNSQAHNQLAANPKISSEFYSNAADEYQVQFEALLKTNYTNLEQVKNFTENDLRELNQYYMSPVLKFLFGPLTNRSIGGEQKGHRADIHLEQAYLKDNHVLIPYTYHGEWIVSKEYEQTLRIQIPLPYNDEVVFSKKWKQCTDQSSEEHQDTGMYWYFWDPAREGCEHREGVEYQMIDVQLLEKTKATEFSYPEYQNMVLQNEVNMTFAFGYVEDKPNSDPMTSSDYGMSEFRKFLNQVRKTLSEQQLKVSESVITENKYFHVFHKDKMIGKQFSFIKNAVKYNVKVVSSTEIDQMELFAVSFAKEHDAFFGWFGHSRVGNGFDADQFGALLKQYPRDLKVSENYQMIYWAGCNSYSYYTQPFFDFKKNLILNDQQGIKSLDIISNGLPSQFSLNADNATILLQALTAPEKKISYQSLIQKIETQSNRYGVSVLVNVLGDEDND